MDILITALITYMFYLLVIKKDTSKKFMIIFAIVIILNLVLFKIHATSTLPISL